MGHRHRDRPGPEQAGEPVRAVPRRVGDVDRGADDRCADDVADRHRARVHANVAAGDTTEPSPTGNVAASVGQRSATTAPAPVEQHIPPIERGEALAKLEIPKIGKVGGNALYVVPGVSLEDLKKGPGHYPETPLPGQLGNASIAGHRTTFGEPFRHIDELEPGDEIIVTMLTGDRFVYEVASTEIVGPDDYFVVTTTDPTVAELTLTSCHPVYTARNRIAVHAFLVPSESGPGRRADVLRPRGERQRRRPARAETRRSARRAPTPARQRATSPPSTPARRRRRWRRVRGGTDGDDTRGRPRRQRAVEVQDAFADGWFHDRGAWPQIALWGGSADPDRDRASARSAATSATTRSESRSAIIPFVVCLYFFYQNVNSLLPPGF